MDSIELKQQFSAIADLPDSEIELARAALLIAATEYPGLNVEREILSLDALASPLLERLDDEDDPLFAVNTLSEYLFDEIEFRGNVAEYNDPRNSFLNDVLSRRKGIPITLSLIYMEVGRRLGVPLAAIGMPGHLLVRHRDVQDLFVDPFYGGILLSERECEERFRQVTRSRVQWSRHYLAPISNRDFVARMLRNLKAIYLQGQEYRKALNITDLLVTLLPEVPTERRDRGLVHYQLGDLGQSRADLEAYIREAAYAPDADVVRELAERIEDLLQQRG